MVYVDTLRVLSVFPPNLTLDGATVVYVNGSGFDAATCANNAVCDFRVLMCRACVSCLCQRCPIRCANGFV